MHYTVEHGDSLLKIAEKLYGDHRKWRIIYDANPQVIVLLPGTVLSVPLLTKKQKGGLIQVATKGVCI
jgi:nucleoid-associated protein YgaU